MCQITANPNAYTAHVAVTQHCARCVLRCTSTTFKNRSSFTSSKLSQRPTSGLSSLSQVVLGPNPPMRQRVNFTIKSIFIPLVLDSRWRLRSTSRCRPKVNTFSAMFSGGGERKCSHSPTQTHRMSTAIRSSFFPCSVMFPPLHK